VSNTSRATLAVLTAVTATSLAMFPRHALIALAIAIAVSGALSRRAAVLVLCALLAGGALGLRADSSPRPHTPATTPQHEPHR